MMVVLNIIASTPGSIDEENSIGVINTEKDGHDSFDEFEPPVVPGNISLSINHLQREELADLYSVDVRKSNQEGHYWDLDVVALPMEKEPT